MMLHGPYRVKLREGTGEWVVALTAKEIEISCTMWGKRKRQHRHWNSGRRILTRWL